MTANGATIMIIMCLAPIAVLAICGIFAPILSSRKSRELGE
jgi:hypothetical protein